MNNDRILIIGARAGGLGDAVRLHAERAGFDVSCVGLSGEQAGRFDVTWNYRKQRDRLMELAPDHIVVTAGINIPLNDTRYAYENVPQRGDWYDEHMRVNCWGPMKLLEVWLELMRESDEDPLPGPHHYTVISSNSAHIARTGSAAYCASKAALSMALRVRAREIAKQASDNAVVYGYEPGLLYDTPMTREVAYWLKENDPDRYNANRDTNATRAPIQMHRMPGIPNDGGIDPGYLASLIVHNLISGRVDLNGCLFRVDAGEQ